MAYLSLYRRWRPQTFAQVVGQQHVVRTLQNALRTGHVAHAYLFAGPRGTGKTSIARLLAKGLNCARGVTPEPCGECESCRRIADGTSLDCLEIDGASNRGIDEVRELRERSKFAPQEGPYKVYIIDEVHMLTTEAFNALLKTLEEPPEHVVFVLATTEAHKVPATILSRCQRFDFHRFGEELVAEHLGRVCAAEGIQATPGALRLLARHAEGGMRDALSLLEQCVVYAGADAGDGGVQDAASRPTIDEEAVATVLGLVPGETIEGFYQALKTGDVAGALGVVEEVFASGADIRQFVHAFAVHLRELLLASAGAGPDAAGLLRWIDLLADAEVQLRAGASPRFVLDLLVLRLALGKGAEAQPVGVQRGETQVAINRVAELESRLSRLEEMLLGRKPAAVASFWEAAELVQRQGQGVANQAAPPQWQTPWSPQAPSSLPAPSSPQAPSSQHAQLAQQSLQRLQLQPQPQPQLPPELKPELQAELRAEPQPEPQPQARPPVQSQAQSQPQAQLQSQPQVQAQAQLQSQLQAQPQLEARPEPEPSARKVVSPPGVAGEGRPAQAQIPAEGQALTTARVQTQAQARLQPQAQAQAGLQAQPQAQVQPGSQTQPGAQAQGPAQPGGQAQGPAQARQQAQAQGQMQPGQQAQTQGPAQAGPQAQAQVRPQPQAQSEGQAQGQAQGQALGQARPPASAPAPAAGAEAGTACIPGAELASVWDTILAQVRQRSIQVQALLREARPAVLLGDTLHLVLPAGCAFHKSGLEQPKVLEMLERVVSRALRRVTHLRFHLGELPADLQSQLRLLPAGTIEGASGQESSTPAGTGPEAGPAVQPGLPIEKWEQADALLNHPLVKKALELFGGQVVQVIPAESRPAESQPAGNQAAEPNRAGGTAG